MSQNRESSTADGKPFKAAAIAVGARFGLTCAEQRLLASLLRGKTLAEHALDRGITIGTARIHLKHIFNKTGHHRQLDLVRAVLAELP